MNIIRRVWSSFQRKVSATAPYIALMYQGMERGVWTKRNYAQYSDDAYKRNVIAYAAIRDVSRGCAKIPLKVMQGGKRELPESHPLVKLLKRPNPRQSGSAFRESVIAYLLLSGNSYVEGVGPDGKPPIELWSLRPDRTKVVPSNMGVAGYTYEVNGQIKRWEADPISGASAIMHMLFFNPLDDWYGMSPIESAAYAVDAHNMAGEWNQGLLQNGCRPSGALVYKPDELGNAMLTKTQRDNLKEELNSAYAGTRNAGRPMLLEGGLDWKSFQLSPVEMDWINGKNTSARDIALAIGVPPLMLGIPGDNTFANYAEARQAFTQDTLIPLNQAFVDHLNTWLCPTFGDDIEIIQDPHDLPALAAVRKERWNDVQQANWMTTNEKRVAVGMPIHEAEEDADPADEILIPSSMVPLSGVSDEPDGDETIPGEDDGQDAQDPTDEEGDKPSNAGKSALDRAIALLEAKIARANPPAPITTFDVPYSAGMSYDGKEWYIDRNIPLVIDVKGVPVNIVPLWYAHELAEHNAINRDLQYPEAHYADGVTAERGLLAELYPDVSYVDYDAACKVITDACQARAETCDDGCQYQTPPRLDHRQYQEEDEMHLLHLGHDHA